MPASEYSSLQPAVAESNALPARGGGDDIEVLQHSFREVSQKVLPIVVEIDVVDVVKQKVSEFASPFDFFFGPQDGQKRPQEQEFKRYGLGSGVIVKHTGDRVYVLTNNHVAGEADEISVKLHDGRQFTAKLVGRDEHRDLALVVFETSEEVPVADLGDSDLVQVGDIIKDINGTYVKNLMGFYNALNDRQKKETVFRIYRQETELIIGLISKES